MDTQSDVEAWLNEGINQLRAGHKDEARRSLMQAVRSEPSNEKAWLYLAATLPPEKAVEALQRVVQINPNNQQAIRGLEALRNYATSIPGPGEDVPTTTPHALRNQTNYNQATNSYAQPTAAPYPDEEAAEYEDYPADSEDAEEFEEANQPAAGYYSPYDSSPTENLSGYDFNLRDSVHFNPERQLPRFDNNGPVTRFGTLDGEEVQPQYVPIGEADDLRSTLVQPYLPGSYRKRRSAWPVFLIVLLIVAILAIVGAIVFLTTQNATPVATQPKATATAVVSTPSVVATVAATATPVAPTPTLAVPTAPVALLPTSTPLPTSKHLQVVQNQSAQLNAYSITFTSYDNHSADFTNFGASPVQTGTHYEGVVVEVANNYNQTLPISVQQFQGIDGRNNSVTPLDTGRLPYLNVPRLQPGEHRAAWLTFEVSDGTTLRAVIFNPATSPDNTSNVLANLVATPAKAGATPPTSTTSTLPTPTPAPQSTLNKLTSFNSVGLTVLSFDEAPNVHPFILPTGYHYEAVMIKVVNQGNQDIVNYLKSFPFELRDGNGFVYTVGPLVLDGPAHFAPDLFATNGKNPGLKSVTGELYFLVRDSAKNTARTLVWYNDNTATSDRVEITLKK